MGEYAVTPDERADYDDSTITVLIAVPPEHAALFPADLDSWPHVTMVFVGPGTEDDADLIAEVASEAVEALVEETIKLGGLGYFDNEQRVAYAVADVSDTTRDIRDGMDGTIRDLGITVGHNPGPWTPHGTLAWLEPGAEYTGEVPACEWPIEAIEVWRGDTRTIVRPGRMDKLAKRGGKWVALSADGTKELGTYDTEAEARERLRQVEAAKAAKDDARTDARSDEEKAEIRKRWQEEGPNIGPARMKEWLDSPFSGPNRKSGDERDRARRVANRALRLMETSTEDWTDADYSGALQVLAFISRMSEVDPGEPLVIDGREGPTPQRASLLDWGFDPKKDADRSDASKPMGEVERSAIAVEFETLVNMTPSEQKDWLGGPYGSHGKETDAALRLNGKDFDEWTDDDYAAAANVIATIARIQGQPPGDLLAEDGPTATDAALMEMGHDPRKDAGRRDGNNDRADAEFAWQWMTQGDGDVRPAHAKLHGKRFARGSRHDTEGEPGEAFGCRCYPMIVPSRGTKREAQAIERTAARAKRLALSRWDHKDALAAISDITIDRIYPAPAVHTESRVHVVEVYRADRVELPTEHQAIRHPHGWVTYPIFYSRIGLQQYPWGTEYRDRKAVFDRKSMDSGVGDPWELRHSADLLTPTTVRGVALGTILTVDEYSDGVHTFGWSKAWAKELLDAIESRDGDPGFAPQVSVAYKCKVDRRPGTTDDGQRFDARQFDIVWNSLASEPRGRAGSARVLTDRSDGREAVVVSRADELLAFGQRAQVPNVTIYYDPRDWVRHDSAATPNHETRTDKDNPMKMLEMMLAKHGKTAAELAEKLGVAEADLAAAMEDEEMMAKAVEFLMMPMREDMAGKVMIGDMEFEVPPEVAAHIAKLEEKAAMEAGRADRADTARLAAETDAKKRKDAMGDMVPRADAERMALDAQLAGAKVIALARRSMGNDFIPASRKDADGADVPVTLRDWTKAAILGAYGDTEGAAIVSAIEAKPVAVQDALFEMRLDDAQSILDKRQDTSDKQFEVFARARQNAAKTNTIGARQDGGGDPLLAAKKSAQAATTNNHAPNGA